MAFSARGAPCASCCLGLFQVGHSTEVPIVSSIGQTLTLDSSRDALPTVSIQTVSTCCALQRHAPKAPVILLIALRAYGPFVRGTFLSPRGF